MNFRQIFRKIIQILLPLALGIILLWFLYRNQDLSNIMRVAKKGVRYDILLFSLIFGLAANTVRGLRWSMLIDSLGKRVNRKNAIYAIWGNYAINMALPRVGEIWRCGVMSKYEKI
ncbi:MAG: flippase-like domain-containing protein, partial [Tannerella sp.]|nr:flippase-like domain-containing protein [Tannerella sp.]